MLNILKNNKHSKVLLSVFIGTVMEWYDFTVFAFLAPTIADLFFPQENKFLAYISIYSVFVVGFLVRPLGALILGRYGDVKGRKFILVFTMMLVSVVTFLMGILPTYQQVGIISPILLVCLRLIQGFCVGGETTGASSFAIETYPHKYRGIISALTWSAVGFGMLLSSLVTSLLSYFLAPESIHSYGWRIPFLFGMCTGVVGYFFRKKIPESGLFLESRKNHNEQSIAQAIKSNKSIIYIIFCLYALSAMITYIIFIFMPFYASTVICLSLSSASFITTLAIGLVTIFVPFSGLLSDLIGRKPCLYSGALGFLLFSYPLYIYMSHSKSMYSFVISEIIFVFFATIYQGALTSAVQELARTQVRYMTTALGYNTSYAIFGGLSPLAITYVSKIFSSDIVPGIFLTFAALIALFSIRKVSESYRTALA